MERHIVNASRNAVDPETTRHSSERRNEPMSFPDSPEIALIEMPQVAEWKLR
jgi:hypothetical protein